MRYSELTRRYFERAPGAGVLGPGAARGSAGSRDAGTWVQFDVLTGPAGEARCVEAVRFQAFGCPHTIAVAAYVTQIAVGTVAHLALPETVRELQARFEVPVEKLGRLLIVEDAWREAMERALAREGRGPGGW
jgi:NifU-like protein involved in Fe-S cluster formation